MRRLVTGILVALAVAMAPALALADPAGSARGVAPAADAKLDGAIRTLVVGSDIFLGDLVQTGPKGQVQILFADNTELVVGPQSSLTIEDYLIRNDGSAGKLVVDMLSGSFRFATGDAAKNRYLINTPTGTIGVRGTGFDVFVDAITGLTRILLYHGRVRYCSEAGDCVEIADFCDVGQFDAKIAELMGNSTTTTGEARAELKQQFIYSDNEAALLSQFRIDHAYECLHKAPNGGPDNTDSGPTEGTEVPDIITDGGNVAPGGGGTTQ